MTNLQVANTIRNQINKQILWCAGANKFTAIEQGLYFNIRNTSKYKFAHVYIKLNASDTYDITIKNNRLNTVNEVNGIYCDELSYTLDGMWESKEYLKQLQEDSA
ncbi:hypothetical protein [Polaribacter sp.]|uniref:hypothetical protein n=1 Tax=Polaribacter sp. TaxID=1920175 RepID=UPI0025E2DA37|nr:hypothetical protein [Polaribacter sp.]